MSKSKQQFLWVLFTTLGIALVVLVFIKASSASSDWVHTSIIFVIGVSVATVGGILPIGKLLRHRGLEKHQEGSKNQDSLEKAGSLIGVLERFLIFVFLANGFLAIMGIIPAVKALVRFLDDKEDRQLAEYYLIGTLASLIWAAIWVFCTIYLIK